MNKPRKFFAALLGFLSVCFLALLIVTLFGFADLHPGKVALAIVISFAIYQKVAD